MYTYAYSELRIGSRKTYLLTWLRNMSADSAGHNFTVTPSPPTKSSGLHIIFVLPFYIILLFLYSYYYIIIYVLLFLRPFFILRILRPRIFESKFRDYCAKKLDGALRKSTSFPQGHMNYQCWLRPVRLLRVRVSEGLTQANS